MIVLTAVGFLSWAVWNYGGVDFSIDWAAYDILIIGLVFIMIVAALVAVVSNSYITVLVALGVVGFGIAVIFAYYGAPDLAITQLLVEVLTVVLFMFVVLRLPPLKTISGKLTRLRDAVVASLFGGLITVLLLKAVNIQFDHAISERLAEMSYPDAKGKNVVNVILVDFRALDTMGEIVVIAAAALGIAALVRSGLKTERIRSNALLYSMSGQPAPLSRALDPLADRPLSRSQPAGWWVYRWFASGDGLHSSRPR